MTEEPAPAPAPAPPPPRPRRKREPKPKRTLAKVLFFCVFLAIFGAIDITAWRYESAARTAFEQSSKHPKTWRKVAQEYPLSYVGCRARSLLATNAPETVATVEPKLSGWARTASRVAVAPALRWLASVGGPAHLEDTAARVEGATFDPLKISLMALLATLIAFALASYQLLAFWRQNVLSLQSKSTLFLVASIALAWQWLRVYGPIPAQIQEYFVSLKYFNEAEYLASLILALTAFCCLFYAARPERPSRIVRETASA